jgi:hypothetical protein
MKVTGRVLLDDERQLRGRTGGSAFRLGRFREISLPPVLGKLALG